LAVDLGRCFDTEGTIQYEMDPIGRNLEKKYEGRLARRTHTVTWPLPALARVSQTMCGDGLAGRTEARKTKGNVNVGVQTTPIAVRPYYDNLYRTYVPQLFVWLSLVELLPEAFCRFQTPTYLTQPQPTTKGFK